MFSESFMVIAVLVVFASQGKADSSSLLHSVVPSSQNTITATPAFSATILSTGAPAATLSTGTLPSPSTTTTGTPPTTTTTTTTTPTTNTSTTTPTTTTNTSTTPTTTTNTSNTTTPTPTTTTTTPPSPKQKTCGNLSLVITKKWDESYSDKSSSKFKNVTSSITADITNLFKDNKYSNLKLDQLDLTEKDGNIGMTAKLCVVKTDDADLSVIDVLNKLNKNGKLGNMEVKEGSVTFKEIGVELGDWEVQDDDECSKCSKGGGGPFVIKRDCTSKTQSCNGLKTKKSEDCLKYCGSCTVAGISFFTLIMGIILSFSFNIWK